MKEKLIKFVVCYGKYILLFFFFFYCLVIAYNMFFGDSIVNYGFSYAISRGQIPYKDFNMVIPIFSPFLYSIPLIFIRSSLVYYITQAILLVFLFVLLFELLKEKSYLFLPLIFLGYPIPIVTAIFPGYNFLLFLFIILLIYLEKNNSNDYIIGIIIGFSILTKHTIGIFLMLPSLFYINNIKKIGKRILGCLIPITIFIIYLLLSNTFIEFFDFCILGLFDFASKNSFFNTKLCLIVFVVCFVYFIYCILKDKKNITNYYLLSTILFCYPLFDEYHLSYFVLATIFLLLSRWNCKKIISFKYIFIFTLSLTGMWTFITLNYQRGTDNYVFKNYTNYPLRYFSKNDIKNYEIVNNYIDESDNNVILFILGTESYFIKITNNLDITYFDLPNYGNYGYNGTDNIIKKLEILEKNTIILIDPIAANSNSHNQQYQKEAVAYIMNKYKKIDDVGKYHAYLKV